MIFIELYDFKYSYLIQIIILFQVEGVEAKYGMIFKTFFQSDSSILKKKKSIKIAILLKFHD